MDVWESTLINIENSPLAKSGGGKVPVVRVTATPGKRSSPLPHKGQQVYREFVGDVGKHIAGVIGAINDAILHAIPPVCTLFPTTLFIPSRPITDSLTDVIRADERTHPRARLQVW